MKTALRLMAILAHPDDESLALGGTLARYAAEGVETYLVTATHGELGWFGPMADYPGPQALGRIREAELAGAATILGLKEVSFLNYLDGSLDQADPAGVISQLVTRLRRVRPQVVVTFDPSGLYGHPDHIAISQFTQAALVAAADPAYEGSRLAPHQVSKLYYRTFTSAEGVAYQAAFGELKMNIDGKERHLIPWPDWAVTTRVDTSAYWRQVWQAVACHRSQLPGYQALAVLPDDFHLVIWGSQNFYRAFSLVNSGREVEDDLFTGVREQVQARQLTWMLPAPVQV